MPVRNPINTHDDPGPGTAVILANGVAVLHGPDLSAVVGDSDRCMVDVDGGSGTITIRDATDQERQASGVYSPPINWRGDRGIARVGLDREVMIARFGGSWEPGEAVAAPVQTVEDGAVIRIRLGQ